MRFTHANRHCPDHPHDTLKRCDDFVIQTVPEQNIEVLKWLEKYRAEREDRTPTRKTPKRNNASNGGGSGGGCENGSGTTTGSVSQNENENRRSYLAPRNANNENHLPMGGSNGSANGGVVPDSGSNAGLDINQLLSSPVTPINSYKSSRKGLMDMNACMSLTSPVSTKSKNTRPKLIHWQD
uniref:Uncharacterized protein n=1 Tax=Anopheles maculatus TaxID=74869 RepID=A0A182SAU1_9DIPT